MLGGRLGHALEPLQFLQRLLLGLLDMTAFSITSRNSAISAWPCFALAELLLSLAKLLAQDVLALAAGQRFLRLLPTDLLR